MKQSGSEAGGFYPAMDFLSNQGQGEPVITVASELEALGKRTFRGKVAPAPPPVAATVLLSILGKEELEWCIESLTRSSSEDAEYVNPDRGERFVNVQTAAGLVTVGGPCLAAPLIGTTLEVLKHLGATSVLAFGWCGAVHPSVRVGEIILAASVLREEGTSYHYLPASTDPKPSQSVCGAVRRAAERLGLHVTEGKVWTTDAPYRETKTKVGAFAEQGVLAVDMETSAVIAVGRALGLECGVLLVASDELWGERWRWGVTTTEFGQARRNYVKLAAEAGRILAGAG